MAGGGGEAFAGREDEREAALLCGAGGTEKRQSLPYKKGDKPKRNRESPGKRGSKL